MLSVKSTSLVKKWHISIQKCKKEKHGQLICTMTKAGLNVYSTVTCLDKKCIIPHYCLLERALLDNVSKPDNWICPTHPWKLCISQTISLITKFRTKILILNEIIYYMPTAIKKSRANLIPTVVMSKEFCCKVSPSISKTSVFWMSKGENLLERWQIMRKLWLTSNY